MSMCAAAGLRPAFSDVFDFGHRRVHAIPDFNIFYRNNANEPSGDKVAWVIQRLHQSGLCKDASQLDFALGRQVFRAGIFAKAARLRGSSRIASKTNETDLHTQLVPA